MIASPHTRPLASLAMLIAASISLAGSFHIVPVPIKHPDAQVFAAQIKIGAPARVWVLDGNKIRIYPTNTNAEPITINLPEESSALDIADIDGDGLNEIIVIDGNRILKIAVQNNAQEKEPEVLFALETALADGASKPYLHVLAVPYQNQTVLALPRNNQFELRSLKGDLIDSFPMTPPAAPQSTANTLFATATLHPVQAAPAGAIEFEAIASINSKPMLPETLAPLLAPPDSASGSMTAQIRAARIDAPNTWPQFNLTADRRSKTTVHYAFTGPHAENTAIRMSIPAAPSPTANQQIKKIHFTSERRYPGNLVFPSAAPPDFNRDGYVDLFLWKSPLPGASIDSLIKSAESGTWPIRFGIHLYSIKKGYYQGKTHQIIETRIPITWFFSPEKGAPIRNLLFEDFNRDGFKDIAFSPNQRTFGVWLYQEGIKNKPDYQAVLPQPIIEIALHQKMDHTDPPTLILRSESSLYILRINDSL